MVHTCRLAAPLLALRSQSNFKKVSICKNCLNTEIYWYSALPQPLASLRNPLKENGGQLKKKHQFSPLPSYIFMMLFRFCVKLQYILSYRLCKLFQYPLYLAKGKERSEVDSWLLLVKLQSSSRQPLWWLHNLFVLPIQEKNIYSFLHRLVEFSFYK